MTSAPHRGSGDEGIKYYFIRRPVMAVVISIVITLLGAFAMIRLPVNRYPQITPPSIQVTAVYPGATAEDVAIAVAAPIEQQLAGLDGLLYYQSSNSNAGVMSLSVYFDISRDQDLAAVEVQNAVKLAEPQLPEEVRHNGILIQKANNDILLVASLVSDDPRYDAAYLTNYTKLYIEDELKRLPGVGNAQTFGELEFSMLVSLDPDKMAQLGITVTDVVSAVREQNATNPAGRIGREPAPKGTQLTLPVTTSGRLTEAGQYGEVIVRALPDGSLVRVRDIADVKLASRSYESTGRLNGTPTTFLLLYAQPGANYLQVKEEFVRRMGELEKAFPAGVRWVIPFDTTPFIEASMEEVVKTLLEAMLLVTLVVQRAESAAPEARRRAFGARSGAGPHVPRRFGGRVRQGAANGYIRRGMCNRVPVHPRSTGRICARLADPSARGAGFRRLRRRNRSCDGNRQGRRRGGRRGRAAEDGPAGENPDAEASLPQGWHRDGGQLLLDLGWSGRARSDA
jgi:multidrug efflux pump subunit AcrB